MLRSAHLVFASLLAAHAAACASGELIDVADLGAEDTHDRGDDIGVVPGPDAGDDSDAPDDTLGDRDAADVDDAGSDTGSDAQADAGDSDVDHDGSGSANLPPIVELAEHFRVVADDPLTLDASASTDPEGRPLEFAWNFGDGATASGATVTHAWADPGTYLGDLTVLDDAGASSSVEFTVDVDPKPGDPLAVITFDADFALAGDTVGMHGRLSSSPGADVVAWDWIVSEPAGTEQLASGEAVGFVLDEPGRHTVRLTITDSLDRTASVVEPFVVASAPVADVRIVTAIPTVGLPITASAAASADADDDIVEYRFALPDGSTTAGDSPEVEFTVATEGTHSVTLTVVDAHGLDDSATVEFDVVRDPSINQPPTVDPGGDRTVARGETVTLVATAADPDGTVVSIDWDFGDGTRASGPSVNHAWATDDEYSVRVTATDDGGAATSAFFTVIVTRPSTPPIPIITITPSSPAPGAMATVDASATRDPDGDTIVEYRWNFGDGTAEAFGVTTSHAWTAAGTYTVTLNVRDSTGATAVATQPVTIACGVDCYDGNFRVLPLGVDEPAEGYCNSNFNIILNPTNCTVDIAGASMTMTCGAEVYRGNIDAAGNFTLTNDYLPLDTGWCGTGYFDETLTGSFSGPDNFSATSNLAFILDWEDAWEDCLSCFFDPFPKTGYRR